MVSNKPWNLKHLTHAFIADMKSSEELQLISLAASQASDSRIHAARRARSHDQLLKAACRDVHGLCSQPIGPNQQVWPAWVQSYSPTSYILQLVIFSNYWVELGCLLRLLYHFISWRFTMNINKWRLRPKARTNCSLNSDSQSVFPQINHISITRALGIEDSLRFHQILEDWWGPW